MQATTQHAYTQYKMKLNVIKDKLRTTGQQGSLHLGNKKAACP